MWRENKARVTYTSWVVYSVMVKAAVAWFGLFELAKLKVVCPGCWYAELDCCQIGSRLARLSPDHPRSFQSVSGLFPSQIWIVSLTISKLILIFLELLPDKSRQISKPKWSSLSPRTPLQKSHRAARVVELPAPESCSRELERELERESSLSDEFPLEWCAEQVSIVPVL